MKLKKLKAEKPWAKLRMTRRQYEVARPWKKSAMERKEWEELILLFPDETIGELFREAEADKFIDAIFGAISDKECDETP
ncbi:MAG: hypothetical protein AB7U63_04790 [Porticoccaceae bacterium]